MTAPTTDSMLALAAQHHQQGRANDAFLLYRQILQRDASCAQAWSNMGVLLHQHGAHADAMEHFARAVALNPHQASVWNNYGEAARRLGQLALAESCYRSALRLSELQSITHNNLGLVLHAQGRYVDAEQHLRRAIELDPTPARAKALANLSNVLRDQMRFAEAESALREALELNPSSAEMRSNLLFLLGYRSGRSSHDVYAESREWQRRHAFQGPAPGRTPAPLSGRRLRIGYVSPDFRRHSVASFFEPILESHDRSTCEVFCYASVARPDDVTERLRSRVAGWHSIYTLGDDQAAQLIRSHELDVLIDLAGHTAGNRLGIFLRAPAAVQACWMGFFATTGISTMDYWITDSMLHPTEHSDLFTERLWRLPGCWLTYRPPAHAPPPAAPPPGRPLCFGSFNQILKVTDETVALWSRLLQRVPGSRLLLKTKSMLDAVARERVRERFGVEGIASDRIELLPWVKSSSEHLGLYSQVDIALDTTPFTGGTTSCEALWMGVPLLTLLGSTMPGRMSASLLHAAGLAEGIARTEADFVEKGVQWATALSGMTPTAREQTRQEQRARIARSVLVDHVRFTRGLESAFRSMMEEKFG